MLLDVYAPWPIVGTTVNHADVLDHLVRVHGVDPSEAVLVVLHEEGRGVLPLPQSDGTRWTPTTVR